jgi:hypothetical protein
MKVFSNEEPTHPHTKESGDGDGSGCGGVGKRGDGGRTFERGENDEKWIDGKEGESRSSIQLNSLNKQSKSNDERQDNG